MNGDTGTTEEWMPEMQTVPARRIAPAVALIFPDDPTSPETWSGVPAALYAALRGLQVNVRPVSAAPPRPVARALVAAVTAAYAAPHPPSRAAMTSARTAARLSPALTALQSRTSNRRLRRGRLDGIIQIGTGYSVPPVAPIATFEDMTVHQAVHLGVSGWCTAPDRAVAARMRAQRRAYEAARACCVTSRWAADSIVEDYGIEREKVHVVGIGRNHDAAPCDRDWSRPRFLWVGAEWERKNGPAVVAAFARIRDVWPDARLDLVGNHPPVHVDGVVGHGRLRLSVPAEHAELERLYGAATCYVMPSRYEAAGIVFADAGAAGLPSIGSTVGGSAEIIGPGGVVVDPEDDAALAVAMGRLAVPEVARRMGAAARTHAESLTWVHVAERLLRVLRVR